MICNDIDVIEKIDERRDAPRSTIEGRYTVRLDPCDGRDAVTCMVLDYSVTGVRLQLPQDMALPTDLQVVIGALSHSARVVWRYGAVIGVDFVDEHYSLY